MITTTNIRRFLSLSAFTALIAAVTLAFAEVPESRTELHFDKAETALSLTPRSPLPLAKASAKRASTKAAAPTKKTSISGLVGTLNLNTATELELIKLPGIGPKKAAQIVEWRARHGKFRRVVDLRRVKGFGAKSVRKLLPYLSVKGSTTLQ